MTDITPLLTILIMVILLWCLDDVLLYAILSFISTYITLDILNSNNGFFTVPPSMRLTYALLWVFVSLIAWGKIYRLAKKARERYEDNRLKQSME